MAEGKSIRINGKDYPADDHVLGFFAVHGAEILGDTAIEETGDWKRAILVRDSLFGMTLVSALSSLLYADFYAKDRERKFMEEGGVFAGRIASAAEAQVRRCRGHSKFPAAA